jgi:molybdenum ABC transporter molybdate-binding protein
VQPSISFGYQAQAIISVPGPPKTPSCHAVGVAAAGGTVVARGGGDELTAVFAEVDRAVAAAVQAQRELGRAAWGVAGPLKVRMAVGVGVAEVRGGDFHGPVLNRLGRILSAGHGGQVLLDGDARRDLSESGGTWELRSLGEHRFKGVGRPQPVFQLVAEGLETDFPPLRTADPAPGGPVRVVVRGYELLERCGEGALGEVYHARQLSVGRDVALKVIRGELVNDSGFVRCFEVAAASAARLDHLHIADLHDFWRDPDGAYLVMRWLEGGSLEEALTRGGWKVGPAARLLSQVGAALAYAHDHGVVHGALGSRDVLLDGEGNAYVSDFVNAVRMTESGLRMRGVTADVAGLGRIAFALLSGSPPPVRGAGLPAIAQMRPELSADVDRVLVRATSADPDAGYGSVGELLSSLLPALEGRSAVTVSAPVRNPYKGLTAFEESDAGDFFGREELVSDLIETVAASPLVAVVGPSGSGKSSVARAGLVAAVRGGALGDGWLVTDMYPGSDPFVELEAALLRVAVNRPAELLPMLRSGPQGLARAVKQILPGNGGELLLVIDQFEELFVLTDDEAARQLFLDALVALAADAHSRTRVVITIRADFFDRPLDHPDFGRMLKQSLVAVEALDADGLAAAIEGPARNVGLEREPGLAAEILSDVGDQPGRLPLLQFALTELFARREGATLTREAYRASGGVPAALARRAEAVYAQLPDEAREAARQVFLRLITLGEGTEDTAPVSGDDDCLGLLAKQIREGAPFDLFAAANVSFVENVVTAGACDAATKAPYARGRIALWTKRGSVTPPAGLSDLGEARFRRIAIANPEHAPYGQAAKQALEDAGLWHAVEPRLVFGENVRQTLQFGETGNVEAAIVALALVVHDRDNPWILIDEASHRPIDQALVVCTRGSRRDGGEAFARFVSSDLGRAVMRRYGFLLPGEALVDVP